MVFNLGCKFGPMITTRSFWDDLHMRIISTSRFFIKLVSLVSRKPSSRISSEHAFRPSANYWATRPHTTAIVLTCSHEPGHLCILPNKLSSVSRKKNPESWTCQRHEHVWQIWIVRDSQPSTRGIFFPPDLGRHGATSTLITWQIVAVFVMKLGQTPLL